MGLMARGFAAALVVAASACLASGGLAQDQPAPSSSAPTGAALLAGQGSPAAAPAAAGKAPAAQSPLVPGPVAPQGGARLAPGQPLPPVELEAFIDGVVGSAMARDHIAGAVVAVVQGGQVVLKKGYGLDRRNPARTVDPDRTLFRIGSITKTFTWIALMREIEAGHIRLDAPINLYLPQKDQIPDQGFKKPVTVRDLLSHSAGFEDRAFGQLMERNPDRIRPLDIYLKQERPRRVREPGALPTFSSYGAALAGEALTQVTGKPTQTLVEAEITGPLGLARTTLREPYPRRTDLPEPMASSLAGDVSQGFHWTGAGFETRPFEYMTQVAPAGAASSTGSDMARYMLAILGDGVLDGATVYSPAIARDFRTTLKRAAPGVRGWDYGFMEYVLPGGFQGQGHEGQTLSFRANMVTIPTLGLGVFVAANTETAGPLTADLPNQIIERFYAPPPAPPPQGSDWLKQNASAFTGVYVTTDRAYRGLEGFVGLLRGGTRVRVTEDGVLVTGGFDGVSRWTPAPDASTDAPYVTFDEVGGADRLVFEMKDGRAQRWFAPSGVAAFERAGAFKRPWLLIALAVATAVASIAALGGLFLRDRRDFRQTTVQGRADAAQISGSILWLVAIACFLAWSTGASDAASLIYDWPGPWLLIASASAFVATLTTVACLGLLPIAWRGGRRLDSWTAGRKARFTATTVFFALFALTLGLWGALEPWSR